MKVSYAESLVPWILPTHFHSKFDSTWRTIMAKHKKKRKPLPKYVRVRLTRGMGQALSDRLNSGFYGRNHAEAAERLLCEVLR